tara:strand:+ start:818 stop:2017 length:1200 start_codon:yes stop_codon:yes gene_type:complete
MTKFIKHRDLKIGWYFCLVAVLFCSCVEPYEIGTETFESALVIEGTITDQLETQEIKLSRSFKVEEDTPSPENNARVIVVGDDGAEYNFNSLEKGIYQSNNPFRARAGVNYTLEVTTQDGNNYSSNPSELSGTSIIDDVSAIRTIQPIGGVDSDGVAILVNSRGTNDNNSYYRYTYEETYEIRSFYQVNDKFIITENGGIGIVPKEEQDYICYTTKYSNEIILTNTNLLTTNDVESVPVHFINGNSRSIAYRYSILVKQFSLSREAYEFYELLKELSGSESLFSQNQPGSINGNVFSVSNDNEKVFGYFSVSAVDSKRLFFNFTDFFDFSEFPASQFDCTITRPFPFFADFITSGTYMFYGIPLGPNPEEGDGPYRVAASVCIDCTILGTTEVPEFWVE